MRLISITCLLLFSTKILADELRGEVVGVADGDTITVLDKDFVLHKVRLQGIDAPEKGQYFSSKSRDHLVNLVGNRNVKVEWSKTDRYGRVLGHVYLGKRHINFEMVQDGMAWYFNKNGRTAGFADAEIEARKARRGLWIERSPQSPWDFRKAKKQ